LADTRSPSGSITDPTPAAAVTGEQVAASSETAASEIATELFLGDMRKRTEASAEQARTDAAVVEKREQLVFVGFVIIAAVTAIAVVVGVVLIFLKLLAVAIVSEAAAVLAGSGTVVLRNIANDLRKRQEELGRAEREATQILTAIGVTLMIPDPARKNDAIAALAAKMTDRIGQ
jgi:hypothetical protein